MTTETKPALIDPIRVVDGVELPIPGTWVIDPQHSSLAFEARHARITRMRGRFRSFSGQFVIAESPEDSTVEVTIDAASIDTTHEQADGHLRGEQFLDVENHPTLTFRSNAVRFLGENRWRVEGDLTIRAVSKPITLDATFEGAVPVARGGRAKLAFNARGQFDRRDYDMEMNVPMPGGGWLVGQGVRLDLDAEADLP
ncbi:MAG: polyisoprenoid-binding protein [Acidimicrobiia bacterium]|nr:polyisoprenoid-binding protein [Acidimicrobiia bacterium]